MNKLYSILLLCGAMVIVQAEEGNEAGKAPDIGLLYSASNLLLDLQSYEGGVGILFQPPKQDIRLSADILYTSNSDSFEAGFGLAFLYPLLESRVQPYWGGIFHLDIVTTKTGTDTDWTRTTNIPAKLSLLFGTEFFLLPHVSVFAEYQLGINVDTMITSSSSGGVVGDPSADLSFEIGSGLGNNGMLGITIYLYPQISE
jgi:hypothetical protein